MTTTETTIRPLVKHSIKWFYVDGHRSDGSPMLSPRESGMRGGDFEWTTKCSCGWQSRGAEPVGATRRQADAHKAESSATVAKMTSLAPTPTPERKSNVDRATSSGFTFRRCSNRPVDFEAKGDCVIRAISLATGESYAEVLDGLNALVFSSTTDDGVPFYTPEQRAAAVADLAIHVKGCDHILYGKYLAARGWQRFQVERYGSPDRRLTTADLPMKGTWIVTIRRHMTLICDGVLFDTWDCTRNGKTAPVVEDVWGLMPLDVEAAS